MITRQFQPKITGSYNKSYMCIFLTPKFSRSDILLYQILKAFITFLQGLIFKFQCFQVVIKRVHNKVTNKTSGFRMFYRGIERDQWHEMVKCLDPQTQ